MDNTISKKRKGGFYRIENPRYNGGLDFWKLIFTLLIVIYHGGEIIGKNAPFSNGATAVEFFFILSGYFMAVSASKKPEMPGQLGKDTISFIWGKIKSILPYYIFAYAISFAAYFFYYFQDPHTLNEAVVKITGVIPNFLLLSMSGNLGTRVIDMTWYISAMLIAMTILYPLLRKYKEFYLKVIAPLSAVLLAGYLFQKYGKLSLTFELDSFVLKEILRAALGINIGCSVYTASEALRKISLTKISRILLGIVELGCYVWVILSMHFTKASYVFIELFPMFVAVMITASKKSILCNIFDNSFIKWTNKFSLALYLCHSAVRRVIRHLDYGWGMYENIVALLIFSTVVALICLLVVRLWKLFVNKNAQKIKPIFIA